MRVFEFNNISDQLDFLKGLHQYLCRNKQALSDCIRYDKLEQGNQINPGETIALICGSGDCQLVAITRSDPAKIDEAHEAFQEYLSKYERNLDQVRDCLRNLVGATNSE